MIYRFGDLELDSRSFELRRAGVRDAIPVEPQVFDVLLFLVQHPERVVTKEELLDSVWGTRFVTESALTSRIKNARKAVGDDGRSQRVIRTVHGRGYRFVAPVDPHETADGSATRRQDAPPPRFEALQLLERDAELATLWTALDAVRSTGAGGVVLVAGEAGLGKTSLIHAFAASVRADGVRVLAGGCDDMVTPRTMGPLRDIAHETGGRLEEVFTSDPDVERVFGTLRDVLAERPTVLVIEDIHWADDATLDAIRFVARRVTNLPVLLVATYRDEQARSGHRLRRALGSLTGPSVRRLALSPLSLEAVTQLAGGVGIPPDELHAVTRGNPFFVTEVLAAGELQVPATVRDAVLSRIYGLSEAARRVLEHAAVIPWPAERALLARLVGDARLALAEAEQAGVLSGDVSHVWFRHELARHAVEASLTPSALASANQAVLDVLVERGCTEPARLVHFAERAGDEVLLREYLPIAANEAIHLGSYSEAARYLELLLRRSDGMPDGEVAVAACQLSYAFYTLNRFADSALYARRGVTAAEVANEPAVLADALLRLARTVYWSEGPRAATAAVERAMPLLGALGDDTRLAAAHAELARARSDLATVGPIPEPDATVVEHAERSFQLAERVGDSYLRCQALQYRGTGRVALGDRTGLDDLALAVELAELDPRDEMPTRACVNAAGGCFRAGLLDEAERYATLGLERVARGEFTAGAYRLELTLQSVRLSSGDWDEAEAGLRALVALPGEPGLMRPLAATLLVRLLARQGRHDDAASFHHAARQASASSDIAFVGPLAAAAIEAAWLAGRAGDVPSLASGALTLAAELGHRSTESELVCYVRRAGHPVAPRLEPVGPWKPALDGRWREAADAWGARGCRYECAVELALAPDPGARLDGRRELEALGAHATLAAVAGSSRRP